MEILINARQVADYIKRNWSLPRVRTERLQPVSENIAAILVDAVFQAGLRYRTVVFPRVCAVAHAFPRLNSLTALQQAMVSSKFNDAIAWNHPEKLRRLTDIVSFLRARHVETIADLAKWLSDASHRKLLQSVRGVGPKTVDYLSRLVGLPMIAVDRHAQRLLRKVGIRNGHYEKARKILEFAADLLKISRSLFDRLMWQVLTAT